MAKRLKPSAQKKYRPRELIKFAFWLKPSLVEECRNATAFLREASEQASLNGLVTDAIERELARLKQRHMGGKEFPQREGALTPGKRPKAST